MGIHPESGKVYATTTCNGFCCNGSSWVCVFFDPADNTPSSSDFALELTIPLNVSYPATNPNVSYWYDQIVHPWDQLQANRNNPTGYCSSGVCGTMTTRQHTQPWLGEIAP
ncbi:MAG: hypothetical protein R2795_13845 [Saprospiraceae bacterium]